MRSSGAGSGGVVDVAIVGAGPAGLIAGYLLTAAGYTVTIIEKDPAHVGGSARTVEHAGVRFDLGEHPFSSRSKAVEALWREILPDGLVERPWTGRIHHEGRFYSDPPGVAEALRNLGPARFLACAAGFVRARLFPDPHGRSFEDRMVSAVGRELHATFVRPHAEKRWGMPCAELSPDAGTDAGAGRMRGRGLWNALNGSSRHRRADEHGTSRSFLYPRLGAGMMWDAARDRIVARGGGVLMGHALRQLSFNAVTRRWTVAAVADGQPVAVRARQVISSMPMRELASRLHPLPAALPEAAKLKYRDRVTVALMIRAPDPFADHSIPIHDANVKALRIRNVRAWSPEMVPDPAIACVALEYPCFEGDGLWASSDDELLALAGAELAGLGVGPEPGARDPAPMIDGMVVRQEKAWPIPEVDHAANVDLLRREIEARYPTLHCVGAGGTHRCDDGEHVVRGAMLTVRNIVSGARVHDIWSRDGDAGHHAGDSDDPAGDPTARRRAPECLEAA